MSEEPILGIDLGTTNTAFAILEAGEPVIIPNNDGKRTTPSVVGFRPNNERVVGRAALNQAVQNPEKTIRSVKRYIGRSNYTFDIGTEEFTPEEISGFILKKVRNDAEEHLKRPINKCVITVPAYFNDKQRNATKNAGEIAGLEVERIINEPTAAAISYGLDKERNQKVLVVDLGGGTFDVSILDLGDGLCEVIATDGIRHLGGDDWDGKIIDFLVKKFEEKHNINLKKIPEARERLKRNAEKAKIDLSTQKRTKINIPFITTTENGPLHLEQEITVSEFDNMTIDIRTKLEQPIEDALEAANLRKRHITNVITVGGSTKMPQIKRKIENISGKELKDSINPDEVVAKGAAIQGGIISGNKDDMILLDVTPKSLGIEVKGGIYEPLIPKNTTIPTSRGKVYTTSEDNQKSVHIKVHQGEQQIAGQNEKLGEFSLEGIPPAEAGTPKVLVDFKINANGMLEVKAKEMSGEIEDSIEIKKETGLKRDEIEEMGEKVDKYEEASVEQKEAIAIRNEADRIVSFGMKILADESAEIKPSEAIKLEEKIESINDLLESEETHTRDLERNVRDLKTFIGEIKENSEISQKEDDNNNKEKYPEIAVQNTDSN